MAFAIADWQINVIFDDELSIQLTFANRKICKQVPTNFRNAITRSACFASILISAIYFFMAHYFFHILTEDRKNEIAQ